MDSIVDRLQSVNRYLRQYFQTTPMTTRPFLLLLATAGCAAGPGSAPVQKPQQAPALPASVFLGNYPTRYRENAQRCWAALPAEIRRHSPPSFRLVSAAELKRLPGLGGIEGSGAYDTANRVVYSRPDYQQMLQHELGGHFVWYEGRDPKSKFPPIMTREEITDWISWNDRNWKLIPQYCSDVPECNRRKPHESFAQGALVTWYPDKRGHPNYGKPNPLVAAKLTSYFGP